MLKVRVIPILLVQDGLLKKPVQFRNPRTVANPLSVVRVFEERQVDELILLDIGRTVDHDEIDPELIREIAEELFVPFAYGGGIRSIESMRDIVQAGAEKVVLNTAAVETPNLISRGATRFGSQCIVVSIDAKLTGSSYEVYIRSGCEPTGLDAVEFAKRAEELGAGEILINSIPHEGMLQGYNLDLIAKISRAVSIPVIAAGGASSLQDFVSAVNEGGASAVAAGSIFHYTKITPNMVKGALHGAGIPVRMYDNVDYSYQW